MNLVNKNGFLIEYHTENNFLLLPLSKKSSKQDKTLSNQIYEDEKNAFKNDSSCRYSQFEIVMKFHMLQRVKTMLYI